MCVCAVHVQKDLLSTSLCLDLLFCSEGLSVSRWSTCSCQRLCGYVVLRRIKFTARRTPLILTFQTFSSSGFYWKEIEWANFTSFCFIIMLHTFCSLFSVLCFLAQTTSKRCTNIPGHSVLVNTQHKDVYMQRHSDLINSVFLPPSPFSLSTHAHTHTHAHKVFAICMCQYERSTQARKRKAELDYLGSLWHERPTDKFLSLPPATLVEKRK